MLRREKFINGEIYHILNRGVDKRNIFLKDEDYFRFIHDLYEFNDESPALNIYYRRSYGFGNHKDKLDRKIIVDILAFCLLPNHFHLLVRQIQDGGIQNFMKKIGAGYANYFNIQNRRTGTLFEGRFKAVLIKSDQHLLHLPYYIHLNPLDLYESSWRERKIKNYKKAIEFLENYRWSSLPDYLGIKNFPSVINKNLFNNLIGKPTEFKQSLTTWLKDLDLNNFHEILLEKDV